MNKTIIEMLIGTLLGDAHIRRTGLNKAFISFEQSSKKIDYINFLHKLIKEEGRLPLMEENLKEYLRGDSRYQSMNKSLYFRTQSLEELKPMADLFLNEEGKKVVPTNIADHLTPRSLAFWIMDDGQRVNRGGVTLCTDSYNKEEVNILREALRKNFNLETTIHNKKGPNDALYERIYIKKDDFEEFKPSLISHMHESMLYKINVPFGAPGLGPLRFSFGGLPLLLLPKEESRRKARRPGGRNKNKTRFLLRTRNSKW
uniref:LAGLIDADG homing endonuclease n=1 Tax=Tephrocybe rancida TaxID=117070 RepID=A0A386TYG3_9AGAR|nr:LAGLIDADG homing endonuclease [Tephrocybe rancida]YP_009517282.1 LAGLIDADG homing endonuclease [Tephrocybe rancida]AYE93181.1 LAGLIDADG homing endonuclease [Tephrocybe rancida]AYE93182.1 LAGLIDADG homing endonuclease [Tephrocybe rancida]